MYEPSPPTDLIVWHRKDRSHLWQLKHRAASYQLAVGLIAGSGDWLILQRGEWPDTKKGEGRHEWKAFNKEDIPPRVTDWSQVPVR